MRVQEFDVDAGGFPPGPGAEVTMAVSGKVQDDGSIVVEAARMTQGSGAVGYSDAELKGTARG